MRRTRTRLGFLPAGPLRRKGKLFTPRAVERRPTRRWNLANPFARRPFTPSEWRISKNTASTKKFGRKCSSYVDPKIANKSGPPFVLSIKEREALCLELDQQ